MQRHPPGDKRVNLGCASVGPSVTALINVSSVMQHSGIHKNVWFCFVRAVKDWAMSA